MNLKHYEKFKREELILLNMTKDTQIKALLEQQEILVRQLRSERTDRLYLKPSKDGMSGKIQNFQ